MVISIISIFPEIIEKSLNYSIIGRAIKNKIIQLNYINLRDFGIGKYKAVDDTPYGGGAGMLLRVDVINSALIYARKFHKVSPTVVLLDSKGQTFNQDYAHNLSTSSDLIFICGHYEGVDERVYSLVDYVLSIGDFILTGSEPALNVVIDATVRLIPGVLNNSASLEHESFNTKAKNNKYLLEYPQYTKPLVFNSKKVPKILLSGNHEKITNWRINKITTVKKTKQKSY